MTTTIDPSLGNGALFTHQGVGTSPGYDAIDDRRYFGVGLQEGVIEPGAYEVTERAAGVGLFVDIAADDGIALVRGDDVTQQGPYLVAPHNTFITEAIGAAHASNPRIDRVVLEVLDNIHDSSGANGAQTRVIPGTATAGATLDNGNGAATVPDNCLLLADVLVPALDTTISNSQIRDRRKWARGAYFRAAVAPGNYTRSSSTLAEIDATNLKPRIEVSAGTVRVRLDFNWQAGAADKTIVFDLFVDGVAQNAEKKATAGASATEERGSITWELSMAAGSHRIAPAWASEDNATTMTLLASGNNAVQLVVEEETRTNAANNPTTTG